MRLAIGNDQYLGIITPLSTYRQPRVVSTLPIGLKQIPGDFLGTATRIQCADL